MRRVAVALVALWACTVNTKTDKLACKVNADCETGRICSDGYCIVGTPDAPPIDAPVCPPACASCDFPTGRCTMQGTGTNVACPAGWTCAITCSATGACPQVSCTSAIACTVTCTGDNACGSIACGLGACDVTCNGDGSNSGSGSAALACASVSCASSCKCDVACGSAADSCGTMTCPTHANKICTDGMTAGAPCNSTVAPACHSCP